MTGRELDYIREAHQNRSFAGDGPFTKRCHAWLEQTTGTAKALLTHSCTAALELSALLLNLKEGDEVIMPSFTFVSTANAFVLRGATPVFVDIRPDTLNINETLIEEAISDNTRAVVPVHYAGVSCEMDAITALASKHNIAVIEDAAQGIQSTYKGKPLGSIGQFGTLSFHETKNVISGEGGALLVNDPEFIDRAEILREKGTDRSRFFRGMVDKYSWQDFGSSFLPGELTSAFLWAQLEEADLITQKRLEAWNHYREQLRPLADEGLLSLPTIPNECQHNAHMFYVLLNPDISRDDVISAMKQKGVHAVFHYVPLHDSPGGQKFGTVSKELPVTIDCAERLIRLPLWMGISEDQTAYVAQQLRWAIEKSN